MADSPSRSDIASRDDIERLVRAFYGKALNDAMIGYLFTTVAQLDLEEHVPEITDFWETILFGTPAYSGGAFAPHATLHRKSPLRAGHFARWLELWHGTVDELYAGPVAETAKAHATRVAGAFQRRVESLPGATPPSAPGSGLVVNQHAPLPTPGDQG